MPKPFPEITKKLLEKMLGDEYVGGRHTALENLPKGFPKHLRGAVNEVADELMRAGIMMRKRTAYGLHVSLDPRMIARIEAMIRDP